MMSVGTLCLLFSFVGTLGHLKIPESIVALSNETAASTGPAATGPAGDPIADRGVTKEQETFPYHIEVKTIHYLLDGIETKIRAQHEKIMNTHKKSQARAADAARTKVAESQQLLDAADKKDKINRGLLRVARAKVAQAQAEDIKVNITRTKSYNEVLGFQEQLRSIKDEAASEIRESTTSNEEQANEALDILGNEQKLVQTVRFMLAELNKKKNAPSKAPTRSEIEKEMLTKTIDVIAEKAAEGGSAVAAVPVAPASAPAAAAKSTVVPAAVGPAPAVLAARSATVAPPAATAAAAAPDAPQKLQGVMKRFL